MANSLLPARYDLTVWEGASWRKTIILYTGDSTTPPQNLTGYTAQMLVRPARDAPPVYTLSTTNGQIILGGTAGSISLYIPSADTTTLPATGAFYELSVTAPGPGDTSSLMWGALRVQGVA